MGHPAKVGRRDMLRFSVVMTAAATSAAVVRTVPAAEPTASAADKRKARYQANSPEVRNFYRVNRYPAR